MSSFKRIAFTALIILACYCGYVCKISHLAFVGLTHQTNDLVFTQEYPVNKKSGMNKKNSLQKDVLNSVDKYAADVYRMFQNSEHTDSVNQTSELKVLKTISVRRSSNFDLRRERLTHVVHPRQRHVDFVNVGNIHVFGAYLDLRQEDNVTVRILAFKHKNLNDSLELRFTVRGKEYLLHANAYKMCENHGKLHEGWILSYHLPPSLHHLPRQISVLPHNPRIRNRKDSNVPVYFPLKTIPSQTESDAKEIGVCVPPVFGKVSLSSIINFALMCKVLGADVIFLYLGNTSPALKDQLRIYSEGDDSVSVIGWDLPDTVPDSEDSIWYHGQLLAIQDCLYHNMASFSFLLFMDLDEMLVPQDTSNWREMLAQIFTNHPKRSVAALSFKSVFFDPTRRPENTDDFLYFRHLRRAQSVSEVRKKVMAQPLKVWELGIHHLSKAVSMEYYSLDVNEKVALLYHYHECVTIYEPYLKCYPTKYDRTMLRYRDVLIQRRHRLMQQYPRLLE